MQENTNDDLGKIVTPPWVYEEDRYFSRDIPRQNVRYTPRSGSFRDANWVEPRVSRFHKYLVTYSVSCNGGIISSNETPLSAFEDNNNYVKWVPNPKPKPSLLKRFFGSYGPYAYWVPRILPIDPTPTQHMSPYDTNLITTFVDRAKTLIHTAESMNKANYAHGINKMVSSLRYKLKDLEDKPPVDSYEPRIPALVDTSTKLAGYIYLANQGFKTP